MLGHELTCGERRVRGNSFGALFDTARILISLDTTFGLGEKMHVALGVPGEVRYDVRPCPARELRRRRKPRTNVFSLDVSIDDRKKSLV